ncbi:ribonucleotide-diphosphate reductase subunit alpha [Candidatus Legionella polyplacis]|uniref:ribonucleoside-diphosphate reductase subunit alpha n=1 Tax=Candidatus Legionella polyplacis TaxID=2005262 RepID=UPI000C1E9550|nr:ribonucleoside-diphosphate reductase subunit alpha [Candidatus Legionella polyplacis]ATW01653.1 ribonucleotide-diphosphate reductase subunit alpha [Candidatus Legionella polyplacis]
MLKKISLNFDLNHKKILSIPEKIENIINNLPKNLDNINYDLIKKETLRNLHKKVTIEDIYTVLIMVSKTLIEKEPNYTYVCSRLLLNKLYNETLNELNLENNFFFNQNKLNYINYFYKYLKKGISQGILDPKLNNFNLEKISKALYPDRDKNFTYISLKTLYDRYLLHNQEIRYELPQAFFMRVAMGLSIHETKKDEKAIDFYNILSSFDYMPSTPTLFNAGTTRPQLSSCYLTSISDNLEDIFNSIKDNALLSKFAGGIGNDWTSVRAMGSHIKGTNGISLGIIPFLNVANATAIAVNQGGKRKGAVCAYLECWHLDVEEFIELRKNTGDDRRRTHDMNTALWIPDLFMKRVYEKGKWTLFSPNKVPDLHEKYGITFENTYIEYEKKARKKLIKESKTVYAIDLWRKILSMLFETGHPWITFKDTCNLRSPQQHCGVIHSSNLCTEITLNTSYDEIAVCNLGSINLSNHVMNKELNIDKLKNTINIAIRMLDNVIDINYYAILKARNTNIKHRPIGLGIMGFQDTLYKLDINYASKDAIEFSDSSMELISYYAIEASCNLAKERGCYSSYKGSLWSKGILPIESINFIKQSRHKKYFCQDLSQHLDWKTLKIKIKNQGIRNSNIIAIAPTATISNICGVSQSIEPIYKNLYVKSNLSGEFTIINSYLVKDLKDLNLWDETMINDLKHFNGSIQNIKRIPEFIKKRYMTAFEIDPIWLIESASRRQKWIDQSQSLNIYINKPSGKEIDFIYKQAWIKGLKTTYYLRSSSASSIEKSTLTNYELNAVKLKTIKQHKISYEPFDSNCEVCQ